MKRKTLRGFTLVEVMVVIATIAIIATVTIVSYSSLKRKAEQSAALQEATQNLHVINAALVLDENLSDAKDIIIFVQNNNNRFTFKYESNELKPIKDMTEISGIKALVINEKSVIYSDDHKIIGISDDSLIIIKNTFGISDDIDPSEGKIGGMELLGHPDISENVIIALSTPTNNESSADTSERSDTYDTYDTYDTSDTSFTTDNTEPSDGTDTVDEPEISIIPDTESEIEPGTQPPEPETEPVTEIEPETEPVTEPVTEIEPETEPVTEIEPETDSVTSEAETYKKVRCFIQANSSLGISGDYKYLEKGNTTVSFTVKSFIPLESIYIMVYLNGRTGLPETDYTITIKDSILQIELTKPAVTDITLSFSK